MKFKLKELRVRKGWSQQEAAVNSGLSIGAIQSIECGRALPSLKTAFQLKKAFNCSYIDDLIEETL